MQVVGIGLVVGLGFVFLTAYLTERSNQQGVSQRIRELMTTVESTVQIACFNKDPALALEVVNGLARNSEVFGAVIVGGSEILAERRKEGAGAERHRRAMNGRISKAIASPFDPAQIVGELIIDPDPEIVSTRVKESGAFYQEFVAAQNYVFWADNSTVPDVNAELQKQSPLVLTGKMTVADFAAMLDAKAAEVAGK